MNKVEQKFIGIVESSLATLDLKLYLLEYIQGTKTLKVFICKEGMENVNIDDCAKVDKSLGDVFENEDFPENLVLEVSSPGVYRFLKERKHFEMSLGELIKLRLSEKIENFMNDFINQSTRYHYVRIGKRMCENTFLPSSTLSEKAEAPRLQPAPTLAASTRACSQHPRSQPP